MEVHRFLCVIAQPVLFAPINPADSIKEVQRVRTEGVVLTARCDGHLIGSLGVIPVSWWYNGKHKFLTDRWFFVYPQFQHLGVGGMLQAEAQSIAIEANMDLVINGHMKRRSNGVAYTRPQVFTSKGH